MSGMEQVAASRKRALRREVEARRRAQSDKEVLSRQILARAGDMDEFQVAGTILLYVSARSEVCTLPFVSEMLASNKRVVVPYCLPDRLQLFRLERMDELSLGTWGILEPNEALRRSRSEIEIGSIDFVFVPGLAFDRRGGRLGHGKAYFDRLLKDARPDATLAAIAFECQLVEQVPMEAHDVWMDLVITEAAVYRGSRRRE